MEKQQVLALVVDTETTGLPERPVCSCRPYPMPQDVQAYDNARMVSIAWVVRDLSSGQDVASNYYVVRPDGFSVEGSEIHGITHEFASEYGRGISDVLDRLFADLRAHDISYIVAHNLSFDMHVIKSELYRAGRTDILDALKAMQPVCTMRRAKMVMHLNKVPKLAELYKRCFPEREEMPRAHNALYDTLHCCECLQWLYGKYGELFIGPSLWT